MPGGVEEVAQACLPEDVGDLVGVADRRRRPPRENAAVELRRGDERALDVDVGVDEAGDRDHPAPVDLLDAVVALVGADDLVATDRDVALRELAGDHVEETGVFDHSLSAVATERLVDTPLEGIFTGVLHGAAEDSGVHRRLLGPRISLTWGAGALNDRAMGLRTQVAQVALHPGVVLCGLCLAMPGCLDDGLGASGSAGSGAAGTTGEPSGGGSAGSAGVTSGPGTGDSESAGSSTSPTTSTGGESESDTGETTTTAGDDPLWDDFASDREDYLHALAVPIVACLQNVDTEHPAFHGCIDWHSAVHATYSLLALYRLTGDTSYLDIVDATLDPKSLGLELEHVEGGALPQELPYGYAWFLTLAREREMASGEEDLAPLAGAIAGELRSWLAGRSPEQLLVGGLADDYANVSWAALNLYQWSLHSGDDELRVEMEDFAATVLLDPTFDAMCPLSQEEQDADDFFPPCLQRAYALSVILPEAQSDAWLEAYLPPTLTLTPILDPSKAHIAGLNFSRAWGLWALYRATGDTSWRSLYVDHVVTHIEQPAYWAEDYYKHSHWVAQFGVYALALSYDL